MRLHASKQPGLTAKLCRRLAGRFENVLSKEERSGLPQCRDPDDQKFLEAAAAAHADFLVSRDRALLEMNRRRARALPFRILTPEAFGELEIAQA